jgi:porphobilinogen synthase
MSFPIHRPRRLRQSEAIRRLVRESTLTPSDFICPLFVTSRPDFQQPLGALPGVDLLSGAPLVKEAQMLRELGVPAVLLFAVLEDGEKDAEASLAWSGDGPVQRAIRRLDEEVPGIVVIADLCLCEYLADGNCGLLRDGAIDNDRTLESLQRAALSLAAAGADVIAPSGMMDGVVGALRSALDAEGHHPVATMPYSAKFASALYGPFKTATRSAPAESRHATHQLDCANGRQAMEEIRLDVEEGADLIIVKPALGYLDVVAAARRRFDVPIAAYNVSGEYNMVHHAAAGDADALRRLMLETLVCIKRAGADMIITYFAAAAARALRA